MEEKNNVIAVGEATGHAHRVNGDGVVVSGEPGLSTVEAPNGADVTHEEHGVILIAPGVYEVGIVREMDHFTNEARRVMD